jgi:F-type H+-transporting ATPase subunit c
MKLSNLFVFVVVALLIAATPVLAQAPTPSTGASGLGTGTYVGGTGLGAGLGAAFTIVGAGYGFGKIGAAALEGMARQPEVAGQLQTAMIVIAALLEGATFFALVVLIILQGNAKW